MGFETYLLIGACYGIGCYLSYKQGKARGFGYAVTVCCNVIGEMSGHTGKDVARMMDEHCNAKRLAKAQ